MPTDSVDTEPIERLAQKVKELITVLEHTRTELARAKDENLQLAGEAERLKTELATVKRSDADLSSLRAERERIRERVGEMLEQLESITV